MRLAFEKMSTPRSYGGSIFSFWGTTIMFSIVAVPIYQKYRRVLFSPCPLYHLLFVGLLMMVILTGVRWYLTVVLIDISLIIRENHNSERYTHPSFYCSTIYSSQDMEAT